MARSRGWILLSIFLAISRLAFAGLPETLGLGSRAVGMGGAFIAVADDPFAAFYNPAGLAQTTKKTFRIGFQHTAMHFPDWHNIVYDADGDGEIDTDAEGNPETVTYSNAYEPARGWVAGLVFPFMEGSIAIGFAGYMPLQRVLRFQTDDPYVPSYVFFKNRLQRYSAIPAIAFRISDFFFGVGVNILADNVFYLDLSVPVAEEGSMSQEEEEEFTDRWNGEFSLDIRPTYALVAGTMYRLGPFQGFLRDLRFGFVFRQKSQLNVYATENMIGDYVLRFPQNKGKDLVLSMRVPVTGYLTIEDFFVPQQYGFGTAASLGGGLLLAFDLTYMAWSGYTHPAIQAEFAPVELPILGNYKIYVKEYPDPGFHDTLVPRIGMEWRKGIGSLFGKSHEILLRAGGAYDPSPVPPQTGESNYIDSDKIVLGTGLGIEIPEFFHSIPGCISSVDFHFQWTHLVKRVFEKDPALVSPEDVGYPLSGSIVSEGNLFGFGIVLGFSYR